MVERTFGQAGDGFVPPLSSREECQFADYLCKTDDAHLFSDVLLGRLQLQTAPQPVCEHLLVQYSN
jgi:hypothetical protein